MKNNREGSDIRFFMGRGSPRGDPNLLMRKARGDPGIYRPARENLTCIILKYNIIVQFKKLKGERY